MPKVNTALRVQIWELWVRGVSIDNIARRLNLTPVQVAKHIETHLSMMTRQHARIRNHEARTEKLMAQIETLEYYLFSQVTQYFALWNDKLKEGDEKAARELSETLNDLINTLQTVLTRKAEIMRRIGLVASAPERVAAVVGTVNAQDLIASVLPRQPVRAELPAADQVAVVDIDVETADENA